MLDAVWWTPRSPDKLGAVPFLAPRVVDHMESLINTNSRILEHGSGGSTVWFAERCREVYAVENNDKWRYALFGKDLPNVFIVPKLPDNLYGFDLMLIDGDPVQERGEYLRRADKLVKPGGWVVLDNANRPEYKNERARLQEIAESYTTFDCNEAGTSYLVTEFYKMKAGQNAQA